MEKDFLYKISEKIFCRFIQKDRSGRWLSKQVGEDMEKLYPSSGKERVRQHYIRKIRLSLLTLLAGFALTTVLLCMPLMQPVLEKNRIFRENYDGNSKEIPVKVRIGEKQEQEFVLEVKERVYSKEQLEAMFDKAVKELETVILGGNSSFGHVVSDLNLVTEMSGYPFRIEWECQDYGVIDTDGKIRSSELPEEGVLTGIKAVFTYEEFQAERLIYLQIFPPKLSEEEQKRNELMEAVEKADKASEEKEVLFLPEELNGENLEWKTQSDMQWAEVLFITFIASAAIYYLKDEEVKKEMKNREKQMRLKYPEIVSKLSLYLGAGMSVRKAWEKTAFHYKNGGKDTVGCYAYEEMRITCQEIKSGISEAAAYDRFGKRCGIPLYRKLSVLLIQNLQKGSVSLGHLLKEESRAAFEERKTMARKAGEEAGTKLLLPMMMMLCVVMLMILLPAFMTF